MSQSKSGKALLRSPVGLDHAVIDSATTTEQSISAVAGFVRSLLVNETLSHDCVLDIDGALFHTIPAGTPPGPYPLYDVDFAASLSADFDDSVTTGNFTVIFWEYAD